LTVAFTVEFSSRAERDLGRLPSKVQTSIVDELRKLARAPYNARNVKRLAASTRAYRLRVGSYRVIYELLDDRLQILVIRVGHRRERYRGRGLT
jgi:mRNA interferase RelE/StbE